MAGSGWWVTGDKLAGSQKKIKIKIKSGNQKRKKIINITKSDILAIFFYTILHARDSLGNS